VLEITSTTTEIGLDMEELDRAVVVALAFEAGFGRHQVMPDVTKFERLARLLQKHIEEKEDDFDMDGRC